jgi:DinB superfamily
MTETAQQYTARMLSFAEGLDPITSLATTPGRVGALIAGRTTGDLQRSPEPGRWSVAQIVSHLADVEIVIAYRVRMILSTPGGPIQAFDQDAWVASQHAHKSDAHASLALFAAIRAATVRLFGSLTDDELERFGMHAERGAESIRHIMRMTAGHDRNHLAQIERLIGRG